MQEQEVATCHERKRVAIEDPDKVRELEDEVLLASGTWATLAVDKP